MKFHMKFIPLGKPEWAKILIENGANVNAEDDEKLVPLHLAALGSHTGGNYSFI